MTSPVTSPLRYVRSATALTVETVLRLAVVPDDNGGHLRPEVVVALASATRPQPIASARPVPVTAGSPAWTVPGCLRRAFDLAHPRTAALAADLSSRAEQFLAGLRMGEEPTEVIAIGQALAVVHTELAAADRMRREWVAGRGRAVRVSTWDLTVDDLVAIEGTPRTMPADTPLPAGTAQALADEYGVLIALCSTPGDPVGRTVAVYRRPPVDLPDDATAADDPRWQRDDSLSHLVVVDGAGGAPQPPAVPAPRTGEPATGWAGTYDVAARPDALLAAVASARTQLELLQGSDEYARLAATHHRTDELDALEHEARLVDGRASRA